MIPNISLNSTTRVGVYVLLLLAGVLALHLAQSVIVPLLIALLLAAVLGPAAVWLQQTLKIRWSLACLLVIFGLLTFSVLISLVFVLAVSQMLQTLPSPTNDKDIIKLYQTIRTRIEAVSPVPLDEALFPPDPKTASEVRVIQYMTEVAPSVLRETANYFNHWAWQVIIIIFTLLFVLLEGRMLTRRVVAIFGPSPEVQAKATEVLSDMAAQVRRYVVNRTLLNFALAFAMGVVFKCFGLNQWLTWAVLLLILNYIPYLGPIVAWVPPFADAFLSQGPGAAAAVTIFYVIAVTIEGYFFFPWFLGRSMDLNATTVMLACLFWDLVWGTTGLFLVMPIMAGIKAMLYHIPEGRAWAELMSTHEDAAKAAVVAHDSPNGSVNGSLPMKPHPVLDAIANASHGLMFPSESEAAMQPFLWQPSEPPTRERLCQQAGSDARAAVEETALAELLRTIPSEDRGRFDALCTTLESELSSPRVFKVGDNAERTVFIVGKTADGCWAGLKTSVVET